MLEDLHERGLITEDNGAKCIFVPKRKVPLMVQKSDGGYGYDTTDLAALRYRSNVENAEWIIYVTDEGQKLHFDTVIEAGRQVGYMDPTKTRYDHVGFGLVLQVMADGAEETKEAPKDAAAKKGGKKPYQPKKGEKAVDTTAKVEEPKKEAVVEEPKKVVEESKKGEESKKPKIGKMKTREGDSTKLMDLIDEAKNRTLDIFRQRMKEDDDETSTQADRKVQVDEAHLEQTAEIMGVSAIKYYDLKQSRI